MLKSVENISLFESKIETFSLPSEPKPFLKWAGGKSQLLPSLLKHFPKGFNTYFEPFLGGGALFFKLLPPNAVLSDSNEELINCYTVVRDNVEKLLHDLSRHINSEDYYLSMREVNPVTLSDVERASRLIFLNKTCFNGLYRVNKAGKFNVPYGRNPSAKICDPVNLRSCSEALRNAKIISQDYSDVIRRYSRKGDFVYFDPPYYPVSKYSDFKRFTSEFFYDADQKRLADLIHEITDRGVYVILSNSDCFKSLRTFTGLIFDRVAARRAINKIGSKKRPCW